MQWIKSFWHKKMRFTDDRKRHVCFARVRPPNPMFTGFGREKQTVRMTASWWTWSLSALTTVTTVMARAKQVLKIIFVNKFYVSLRLPTTVLSIFIFSTQPFSPPRHAMVILNLQLQSAARVSAVVRVIRYKVNKVDSFINFFFQRIQRLFIKSHNTRA